MGLKSTWGDGRTRFNAAAFYYDYEDFQTFRFELLNQIIFNTDAEVTGGELELQTSPVGGLGHRARPRRARCQGEGHPEPVRRIARARDGRGAGHRRERHGALRVADARRAGSAIQGTVTYQDDIYYDIQNVPVSFEDGYTVGNLRLSYANDASPWEIAAFVDNVTDEEYLVYTFDFTGTFGFNQLAYGKPRWAGVSFRYSFR